MVRDLPAEFGFVEVDWFWRKRNMVKVGASSDGRLRFEYFPIGLERGCFDGGWGVASFLFLDPPLNNAGLLDIPYADIVVARNSFYVVVEAELPEAFLWP